MYLSRSRFPRKLIVTITTSGSIAVVKFPYDERAVNIIKSIEGRWWSAEHRHWRVPTSAIDALGRKLLARGFRVRLDGTELRDATRPWL